MLVKMTQFPLPPSISTGPFDSTPRYVVTQVERTFLCQHLHIAGRVHVCQLTGYCSEMCCLSSSSKASPPSDLELLSYL